jgi:hypothetical protein
LVAGASASACTGWRGEPPDGDFFEDDDEDDDENRRCWVCPSGRSGRAKVPPHGAAAAAATAVLRGSGDCADAAAAAAAETAARRTEWSMAGGEGEAEGARAGGRERRAGSLSVVSKRLAARWQRWWCGLGEKRARVRTTGRRPVGRLLVAPVVGWQEAGETWG